MTTIDIGTERTGGLDNALDKRPWRSVQYEEAYLHAYEMPTEPRAGLALYLESYNFQYRHSALDRRTPDAGDYDQPHRYLAA